MTLDREKKLNDIIDRDDIWQTLLRYSRGIDRFDRDLVRSCYWDDAVDDHHLFGGTPDQFLDLAIGYHQNAQTITHHALSNHYCELDGDNAHAETYYLFIGVNVELPHLMSIGRYVDHFQRRDGEWKIYSRVCVIERNYALHDHPDMSIAEGDPVFGPVRRADRTPGDISYERPLSPRLWGVARNDSGE